MAKEIGDKARFEEITPKVKEEGLGQQDIGAQRGHQEASGHADHIALPVAADRASEDDDVPRYQIQGSCEAYWTVGLGMNLGDCKSWPSFVA